MNNLRLFILKIENLLSIVVILIAIVVTFLDIFSDILNERILFEAILVVLALHAVTNTVEREHRSRVSDMKLREIHSILSEGRSNLFFTIKDIPNVFESTKGASEFFVAGAQTFSVITRNLEFWEKWLNDGKTLKVIIPNPHNEGLKSLDLPMANYSYDNYINSLKITIANLKYLSKNANVNLQVRFSNACPTQGITITDGHLGGKMILVVLLLPYCESNSRPHFKLINNIDNEWFDVFYSKYYKTLWNQSEQCKLDEL